MGNYVVERIRTRRGDQNHPLLIVVNDVLVKAHLLKGFIKGIDQLRFGENRRNFLLLPARRARFI